MNFHKQYFIKKENSHSLNEPLKHPQFKGRVRQFLPRFLTKIFRQNEMHNVKFPSTNY